MKVQGFLLTESEDSKLIQWQSSILNAISEAVADAFLMIQSTLRKMNSISILNEVKTSMILHTLPSLFITTRILEFLSSPKICKVIFL